MARYGTRLALAGSTAVSSQSTVSVPVSTNAMASTTPASARGAF
jgi:hypothetical protein